MKNTLYYGDNLDILRKKKIKDETVDLCYIDPPFNSKRNYNQIYNNIGDEDRAQAQAFVDTWTWDEYARDGYTEILANDEGSFPSQLVDLITGLRPVLGEGSLLAYLISMALRIVEIHRVLKPTGSFFLHCDPTASHYLKLVLDAVFSAHFQNEIIWHYTGGGRSRSYFSRKHDVIFWYSKTDATTFNIDAIRVPYKETSGYAKGGIISKAGKQYMPNPAGTPVDDVWDIPIINPLSKERLGYPTQKPENLLQRIIEASSNEGDVILDAYCGCGTTIAVAERLKRRWIGIDITYQSISLVLRRLEKAFGATVLDTIKTDGIPRDMESAVALAHKKDDRLRKEFEKWAVLTYTNNRAIINDKKGADAGIDGIGYFLTAKNENARIIFQVKSGGVKRGDIATLRGDMAREEAALAILITLEEPSGPMLKEAKAAGQYKHEVMGRSYDKISIVTIHEIVEGNKRLDIPMSLEVLAAAKRVSESNQLTLLDEDRL
ncbi:MAG: restriction endonuclease [Planctomycetales bacterium]|nr:restriction endonuclease [Planctomycetales bacterium]